MLLLIKLLIMCKKREEASEARTGRNLGNDFIVYIVDNDPICYGKTINLLMHFG
jgi:hypothetical protein